jgi:hypothetical protein
MYFLVTHLSDSKTTIKSSFGSTQADRYPGNLMHLTGRINARKKQSFSFAEARAGIGQ